MRRIGLEEHFIIPDFIAYLEDTYQNINQSLASRAVPRLQDVGQSRIEIMDAAGLDFAVLSIAGPGVQIEPDTTLAVRRARQANDALAEAMRAHPARFGGLAHLAMQDPLAAADELERCVTELGMQGAMVNGQTNGVYLDDARYEPFWERAAALKAPLYIHPGNPVAKPVIFEGAPELWGPFWSWGVETASHALRLVVGGVFERHPDARVILGHMGETLPFLLWRFDSRLPTAYQRTVLKEKPSFYIRRNIAITTSGVCDDAALICSLDSLGEDSVMLSLDYPFEDPKASCEWIERAAISEARREKVTHANAEKILLNMK